MHIIGEGNLPTEAWQERHAAIGRAQHDRIGWLAGMLSFASPTVPPFGGAPVRATE
jgi:hypothetical protein